jgi:tetratricopeptide (TPR) repeat protein
MRDITWQAAFVIFAIVSLTFRCEAGSAPDNASLLAIQDQIQAGHLDAALQAIAAALRQSSQHGGLLNLRGIVYAQKKQFAKAEADFAAAVREQPELIAAWQNLARACQIQIETDPGKQACAVDAWQHVEHARPDDEEANTNLAQLASGPPQQSAESLPALQRRVLDSEKSGDFAGARRTLERVAALDPKNTAHLLELARIAEKTGDHEGALGYLAHARDLEPERSLTYFLMARIESELDLVVEARKSLERALQLEPKNPAYNYAMGFVILSTRDAATASGYFQKFVTAFPQNPKGHYALGIAYYASGDYPSAKAEFNRVKSEPSTAGGAAYFLGCIARREDELDSAASFLHRSVELLPTYAESHTELARIYLQQKENDKARNELQRALQINPQSFSANEQLLVLYRRTKDERAGVQADVVKKLDEDRSRRADLMVRSVEFRP